MVLKVVGSNPTLHPKRKCLIIRHFRFAFKDEKEYPLEQPKMA